MLKHTAILTSLFLLTFSARAAFVAFEAQSGVLGADFTNGTDGTVQYISISTDTVNSGNPGNANRVATYTVTFPAPGTYDLYARVLVGPGAYTDDSMFYGNGFGVESPTTDGDWLTVNGLASGGFTASTDVVAGNGSAGIQVWKWVNLSQFDPSGSGTETPITFAVSAGHLTQTFQIGGRENGLDIAKFVFGTVNYTFTVSNLDNGTDGTPPPPPNASINWNDVQQHIDGFGFSSAWCGQLSSAKNNALYNTLGMSILRVRIDPNQSWSQETANAAAAHAYGAKVLGSEWTPPASMKSNTNTVGGSLLPGQYAAYAGWLNLAANSIGLDYVSFQNEPDATVTYESCSWTPTEILNFVKTNAPAIGKPVVMPESQSFNDAYSDPVINDPVAVNNFAILGGHFYGGGNYVHTNALAHGKPVWMTEHYLPDGTTNFAVCLNWAKEINTAMNNQFSAYIAWWVQDGDTNINLVNSSGHIYKDGYTLGQFAKFIRPGYYRIGATNTIGGAQISAYKDLASNNFVIVALNLGNTVVTQQFNLNGFPAASSITPWITSYTQSLTAQTPITNIGSSFTYSIQPSNIVTLVGTPLANTPPTLAPIADQTIGVGVTLNITNVATDSDVPKQTLTYSLPTAPTNATINAGSGVLTWRPLVTQANTTNQFTVMVADNGTPSMSATQSFVVTVTNLVQPQLSTVSWSNGQLVLQVSGASGPDYQIQSSTNLVNWSAVFTTNSPPMPFVWTNSNTSLPMSFFRVLVGPPF